MSNNPPGVPRFNALTMAMDRVAQYNQEYTPRALGGQGVPEAAFVPRTEAPVQPMPTGPAPMTPPMAGISPEEAQRRLLAWAAESGQMLDPNTGNVVARMPVPQAAPYSTNPGVIRSPRMAEVPGYQQYPQFPVYSQPAPPPVQAPMPRVSLSPMSIQSIQSIDFDRSVVWADGTPFPFDLREAQPVLQFALEVILRQFTFQFGALLQRYGFVSGVQTMPTAAPGAAVPPGSQQALGTQVLLPTVPRGDAAGVPGTGTVQNEVPGADAAGEPGASGDSAPTS